MSSSSIWTLSQVKPRISPPIRKEQAKDKFIAIYSLLSVHWSKAKRIVSASLWQRRYPHCTRQTLSVTWERWWCRYVRWRSSQAHRRRKIPEQENLSGDPRHPTDFFILCFRQLVRVLILQINVGILTHRSYLLYLFLIWYTTLTAKPDGAIITALFDEPVFMTSPSPLRFLKPKEERSSIAS